MGTRGSSRSKRAMSSILILRSISEAGHICVQVPVMVPFSMPAAAQATHIRKIISSPPGRYPIWALLHMPYSA